MSDKFDRRNFMKGAGTLSGVGMASSLAAGSKESNRNQVERTGSERFHMDLDQHNGDTLISVYDSLERESYHYIAYTSKGSIKPFEIEVSDHESLVESVKEKSVGIFDHSGPFPEMPDFVERWDHFSTKTSNSCGSVYGDHYMVGLTMETTGPISTYAGSALGGAFGAALGIVVPGSSAITAPVGSLIGGAVGAIISNGYDTHSATIGFADHDVGPWWATAPVVTSQIRGRWNYQRANHMQVVGSTSPGVHVSPVASEF